MEKEIIRLTKKNYHRHQPIDCDSFLYKCPWTSFRTLTLLSTDRRLFSLKYRKDDEDIYDIIYKICPALKEFGLEAELPTPPAGWRVLADGDYFLFEKNLPSRPAKWQTWPDWPSCLAPACGDSPQAAHSLLPEKDFDTKL